MEEDTTPSLDDHSWLDEFIQSNAVSTTTYCEDAAPSSATEDLIPDDQLEDAIQSILREYQDQILQWDLNKLLQLQASHQTVHGIPQTSHVQPPSSISHSTYNSTIGQMMAAYAQQPTQVPAPRQNPAGLRHQRLAQPIVQNYVAPGDVPHPTYANLNYGDVQPSVSGDTGQFRAGYAAHSVSLVDQWTAATGAAALSDEYNVSQSQMEPTSSQQGKSPKKTHSPSKKKRETIRALMQLQQNHCRPPTQVPAALQYAAAPLRQQRNPQAIVQNYVAPGDVPYSTRANLEVNYGDVQPSVSGQSRAAAGAVASVGEYNVSQSQMEPSSSQQGIAPHEVRTPAKKKEPVKTLIPQDYNCKYCDQKFQSYFPMRQHIIATHPGRAPYDCIHEGCKQRFGWKQGLVDHEKTHDGRPHKCPICNMPITHLAKLRQHVARVHGRFEWLV